MALIEFKNLSYFYQELNKKSDYGLKNINLKVEKGDYVCVIGHTGSGKTTLLKQISSILKPTSGSILINGVNFWDKKKVKTKNKTRIGFVFQNPAYQLFEETVEKDIAFGPKNLELCEEEINLRVKNAAEMVGLSEDLLKKSPFELSGGQKRRAAIAGVIATEPEILLLDEPTSGLDPIGKNKILNIIKKYNEKFCATIFSVTHNMDDIYLYANKVLVLNKGEVFSYGTVEETFKNVENLQKIGLDIPEISKVFLKLKEKGFLVPTNVYSVEKAVDLIKNILLKKEKKC